MNLISRSALAMALLAAASACQQPADDAAVPEANDQTVENSLIDDPGNMARDASTTPPTPEKAPPAAEPKAALEPKVKIAPVPKTDTPKAPPPPEDPHAGHDMNKM